MGKILAAVAAITVAVAVIVLTLTLRNSFDPVSRRAREQAARFEAQRQALDLQRQQWEFQQAQQQATAVAPVVTLAGALWTLAPLVIIGGVLWLVTDAYRLRRRLVKADAAGRLPVPRAVVEVDPRPGLATIAGAQAIDYERARQSAAVPTHLSYAPRILPPRDVPALLGQQSEPQSLPAVPPSKIDLVTALQRFTPSHDQLLIGMAADGPIYRGLEQLLHVGVLGSSGSGKSTSQLALAVQIALIDGARLVVLDPEAATFQALRHSPRLLLPFPDDGAGCLANLEALQAEMTMRRATLSSAGAWDWLEYNREQGGRMTPIFGFVDELATLASYADTEPLLLDLARRGRKCGMYLVIASQTMKRADVGSTTIRQQLATKLLLRVGEPAQGRALGLETSWCKQATEFSEPGLAVYAPTDGPPAVIRVPYVSKSTAAHLLRGATMDTDPGLLAEPPSAACIAGEPARTARTVVQDHAIIRRMHAAGMSQNQIIELAFGVKKGGSEAYRQAREAYRRIIEDTPPRAT